MIRQAESVYQRSKRMCHTDRLARITDGANSEWALIQNLVTCPSEIRIDTQDVCSPSGGVPHAAMGRRSCQESCGPRLVRVDGRHREF